MQFELSDSVYQKIAAKHGDVAAFIEATVKKALDENGTEEKPRFDADRLLVEFRSLQGMFGDSSLRDVLSSRRSGLE